MKDTLYEFLYNNELNHWWYKARRLIVHNLIKKYFPANKNLSILDVGCGTGALTSELSVYGEIYGLDFSEKAVSFCRERGIDNVRLGSIENIPYENDFMDIVIALDVLEHLKDDSRAISEMYRVLKPGGLAIVFVPTFMFLWSINDVEGHHFRRYVKKEVVGNMKNGHFSILRSSYFNFFLFFPILIVRLFVRLLHIPVKSENISSLGFLNRIFYWVFRSEVALLTLFNMPIGVSCMVIAKK